MPRLLRRFFEPTLSEFHMSRGFSHSRILRPKRVSSCCWIFVCLGFLRKAKKKSPFRHAQHMTPAIDTCIESANLIKLYCVLWQSSELSKKTRFYFRSVFGKTRSRISSYQTCLRGKTARKIYSADLHLNRLSHSQSRVSPDQTKKILVKCFVLIKSPEKMSEMNSFEVLSVVIVSLVVFIILTMLFR